MSEANPYEGPRLVINNDKLGENIPKPALKGDGGGDRFDPMEQRVAALEKRFDRFEAKLDTLVRDVAEVKGRVGAMPTAWQLLGMILAIMGASFAIIRFGLH